MTLRKRELLVSGIYHVYNRSIAKQKIFDRSEYLSRVFALVDYYRYQQTLRFSKYSELSAHTQKSYLNSIKRKQAVVAICAFSFMPNHFHLVLHQLQKNGITYFISNFQNSFAKYFNTLTERTGGLFQDRFKAKYIPDKKELQKVIRYVHLNPVTAKIVSYESLSSDVSTSHRVYLKNINYSFMDNNLLERYFDSESKYESILMEEVRIQQKLRLLDGHLRGVP